jgi:hypothetical protein
VPEKYLARTSAAITWTMPDMPRILVFLEYDGTPDKVKEALRRASSHRRTIIVARTNNFFFNVIHQLARLIPQDCGGIYNLSKGNVRDARLIATYSYDIGISGRTPIITWGSKDNTPLTENLFRWLGSEWRRPTKPRLPRVGKAKGGRPSGFRQKFPELIVPSDRVPSASSKALGLKHTGRRIIPVDFSKMTGAVGPYDQDAEFNEVWEDSLTPAERAEGPGA